MDQDKLNRLSAEAHSLNLQIVLAMSEIADQRQEISTEEKRLEGPLSGTEHIALVKRIHSLKTTLRGMQEGLAKLQTKLREVLDEIEKELTN